MIKKTLIALLFAVSLFGQTKLNVSSPTSVYPGSTVNVTISLSGSAGTNLAGLQWAQALVPNSSVITNAGAAATTAIKTIYCNTTQTFCLVTGLTGVSPNQVVSNNVLSDGVVAQLTMVVPASAPLGPQTLTLTNLLGASTTAAPVSLSSSPVTLNILSFCDLNGDGVTNAQDVLTAVNQATGISTCTAAGGTCSAVTVERVVVGAGGGACPVY